MFGSEFPPMDNSIASSGDGEEASSGALSMDYAFHRMNFSTSSDDGMQVI
jgi:hypothetical protein